MTLNPSSNAVRPSRSTVVRDIASVVLILSTMLLPWTLSTRGSDHWYVVLFSLIAATAPGVTYLARAGAFGPSWDVGYNRLIRYGAVAPWLICFLVLVIRDLFVAPGDGYFSYDTYEYVPDGAAGIGIGATIGLVGALAAIQPRLHERGADGATSEDRVWVAVAQVLAGLTLAAFLITAAIQQVWDAGLLTFVLLVLSAAIFVLITLPMVGTIRLSSPWILVAAAMTVIFVLFGLLTIGNEGLGAAVGIGSSDGESAHYLGYGMTYFAAAATAATAPRGTGLVGDVFDPNNFRAAAGRLLLILAVLSSIGAITVITALTQGVSGASMIVLLFLYLIGAIGTGLGAAQLWQPGGSATALIGTGLYVVTAWISNVIGGESAFGSASFGDFLSPALFGLAVALLVVGPPAALAAIRSGVQGFAVQNRPSATGDVAEPETPVASQDWGDLAPVTHSPTPAAPAPPALPPMSVPPTLRPIPPPARADPLLAEAADPATSLERLAEIVSHHPHARASVAANPSTYPALLEWLGAVGDPEIDSALQSRVER